MEGEFEDSGEEEEELNDYQDSPEEQNSNMQVSFWFCANNYLSLLGVGLTELTFFSPYKILVAKT